MALSQTITVIVTWPSMFSPIKFIIYYKTNFTPACSREQGQAVLSPAGSWRAEHCTVALLSRRHFVDWVMFVSQLYCFPKR